MSVVKWPPTHTNTHTHGQRNSFSHRTKAAPALIHAVPFSSYSCFYYSTTLSPTLFLFITLPCPSYLCCHDKYIDIEHLLSYFSHLSFCFMLLHFRIFVRVSNSNSNGSSCCYYYYKTTTAQTTTTTVIIATITNKNTKTITTLFIGVLREVAQEV